MHVRANCRTRARGREPVELVRQRLTKALARNLVVPRLDDQVVLTVRLEIGELLGLHRVWQRRVHRTRRANEDARVATDAREYVHAAQDGPHVQPLVQLGERLLKGCADLWILILDQLDATAPRRLRCCLDDSLRDAVTLVAVAVFVDVQLAIVA